MSPTLSAVLSTVLFHRIKHPHNRYECNMIRFIWAACLALVFAAMSGVEGRAAFITDPTGDTFNTGTIDITGTQVVLGSPTTTISIRFAGVVAAPSTFAANSVLGYVDLDTLPGPGGTAPWGGPVSGGNNWINYGITNFGVPGPTVALGDEFYIDLSSEFFHPGLVDVVDTTTNLTVGVAPVSYVGNLLTINLASALIGSPGSLRYGAIVGDFLTPTDRAPNGASGLLAESPMNAVPAPAGLLLAVTGLPIFGLVSRLRRRSTVQA